MTTITCRACLFVLVVFGWELRAQEWVPRLAAVAPPARLAHVAFTDDQRDVVVVFGGISATNQALNDTWEWDGVQWTERHPVNRPPARAWASGAYDAARGFGVVFGGAPHVGAAAFGDTWEWDGNDWSQRSPAQAPTPRVGAALAFDATRGVTLLFGGDVGGCVPCLYWPANVPQSVDETWEWDGTTWTARAPSVSPGPRAYGALAHDPVRGRTVLAGGTGNTGTYEWDGTTWHAGPALPMPRRAPGLAFAPSLGRTVLFGGLVPSTEPEPGEAPTSFGDTWEWDGVAWTSVSPAAPPLARGWVSLTRDPVCGGLLAFSGAIVGSQTILSTAGLWHYDAAVAGGGQPNGPDVRLDVAGTCWAARGGTGPFPVDLTSGGEARVALAGPAGAPFVVFAGPSNPGHLALGCAGVLDVGTPPGYLDVVILLDGLTQSAFALGADGRAHITLSVPSLPPGPLGALQAAVFPAPSFGCGTRLTASFVVSIL